MHIIIEGETERALGMVRISNILVLIGVGTTSSTIESNL